MEESCLWAVGLGLADTRGHCQHAEVAGRQPRHSRQHPRPPGNFAGTSIHQLDPEEPATVGSRGARGPCSGLRSSRRNDAEGWFGVGGTDIWTALPSFLELPDIWTASFRGARACAVHVWLSDGGGGGCAIARGRAATRGYKARMMGSRMSCRVQLGGRLMRRAMGCGLLSGWWRRGCAGAWAGGLIGAAEVVHAQVLGVDAECIECGGVEVALVDPYWLGIGSQALLA